LENNQHALDVSQLLTVFERQTVGIDNALLQHAQYEQIAADVKLARRDFDEGRWSEVRTAAQAQQRALQTFLEANETAEQKAARFSNRAGQLSEEIAARQPLERQIAALQQKVNDKQTELDRLNKKNTDILVGASVDRAAKDKAVKETERLQAQLAQSKSDLGTTQKELNEKNERLADGTTEIGQLKADKKQLANERDALQAIARESNADELKAQIVQWQERAIAAERVLNKLATNSPGESIDISKLKTTSSDSPSKSSTPKTTASSSAKIKTTNEAVQSLKKRRESALQDFLAAMKQLERSQRMHAKAKTDRSKTLEQSLPGGADVVPHDRAVAMAQATILQETNAARAALSALDELDVERSEQVQARIEEIDKEIKEQIDPNGAWKRKETHPQVALGKLTLARLKTQLPDFLAARERARRPKGHLTIEELQSFSLSASVRTLAALGPIILGPQPTSCTEILNAHNSDVNCVAMVSNGMRAVSGSTDQTVRVWDLTSGECTATFKGHTSDVRCVAVTPDGSIALTGSNDKTLRVWDLASGQCTATLIGHTDWVTCVAITPDGKHAISGSYMTLRVWDLDTGECTATLEGHSGWVKCVAVTPNRTWAISGSNDTTLRVWDLASGKSTILNGHTSDVNSVALTPNKTRAVSGSSDKTLRVWDLATNKCIVTLKGHTAEVECLAMTPDGKRAVSGSSDRTLKVWDLVNDDCSATLEGHTDTVTCASLTPNGTRAISSSSDNTLRIWNAAKSSPKAKPSSKKTNLSSPKANPSTEHSSNIPVLPLVVVAAAVAAMLFGVVVFWVAIKRK
jgi:WD40 repeat protein